MHPPSLDEPTTNHSPGQSSHSAAQAGEVARQDRQCGISGTAPNTHKGLTTPRRVSTGFEPNKPLAKLAPVRSTTPVPVHACLQQHLRPLRRLRICTSAQDRELKALGSSVQSENALRSQLPIRNKLRTAVGIMPKPPSDSHTLVQPVLYTVTQSTPKDTVTHCKANTMCVVIPIMESPWTVQPQWVTVYTTDQYQWISTESIPEDRCWWF